MSTINAVILIACWITTCATWFAIGYFHGVTVRERGRGRQVREMIESIEVIGAHCPGCGGRDPRRVTGPDVVGIVMECDCGEMWRATSDQ